jgi:hypothetical protein
MEFTPLKRLQHAASLFSTRLPAIFSAYCLFAVVIYTTMILESDIGYFDNLLANKFITNQVRVESEK